MSVTGTIFDMQRFAVHDGPGIRTAVFFKGCPLRCSWCHNPESQSENIEMGFWREQCRACLQCALVCPNGLTPRDSFRSAACTACGACARACPHNALRTIGRRVPVEVVVEHVLRDKPFYDACGGGVTLTGGEPTAQPDFLLALLNAFRASSIHTVLETSGCFPSRLVDAFVEQVDVFLFDIKHVDDDTLWKTTGAHATPILTNFRLILERVGIPRLIPRIPLIPGFNANAENCREIAAALLKTGYRGPIHLLPFNSAARKKFAPLGREMLFSHATFMDSGEHAEIERAFWDMGLEPIRI